MDFFAHQDAARSRTRKLLFLYGIAVVCMTVVISALIALAILPSAYTTNHIGELNVPIFSPQSLATMGIISLIILTIILSGTAYKITSLASGGSGVAQMLGGSPLDTNTIEPSYRQLSNVVEEIAIASGIPVPRIYVLKNEQGINAFAAGFTSSDAVIGVTQGAIEHLSRDQLQGVIAHEFSHILNGDMKLNIRAIGLLHGIIMISLIGDLFMRIASNSETRPNPKEKGNARNVLFIIGIILATVGYFGVLAARIIKSAISRQREYLADASAVQFTRNPQGIASALKKILTIPKGSTLESERAEETSHMFFSNGMRIRFVQLFSTHPPLKERIRRIDRSILFTETEDTDELSHDDTASKFTLSDILNSNDSQLQALGLISASIGTVSAQSIKEARLVLERIAPTLSENARDPYGARAVVYGLLLSPDETTLSKQKEILGKRLGKNLFALTMSLANPIAEMPSTDRLPLLNLTLPALCTLSESQHFECAAIAQNLIVVDRVVALNEYIVFRIIFKHLAWIHPPESLAHQRALGEDHSSRVLLSTLAWASNQSENSANHAFRRGYETMPSRSATLVAAVTRDKLNLQTLEAALTELDALLPSKKKILYNACIHTALSDSNVTLIEMELLRLIGSALDCPVPIFATSGSYSDRRNATN